jgi:hypothetical protein
VKKHIGLTFDYETILSSEETQPEEDALWCICFFFNIDRRNHWTLICA